MDILEKIEENKISYQEYIEEEEENRMIIDLIDQTSPIWQFIMNDQTLRRINMEQRISNQINLIRQLQRRNTQSQRRLRRRNRFRNIFRRLFLCRN